MIHVPRMKVGNTRFIAAVAKVVTRREDGTPQHIEISMDSVHVHAGQHEDVEVVYVREHAMRPKKASK